MTGFRHAWSIYETFESRLATFQNYRGNSKMKIKELADAGFYYSGNGFTDKTMCYSCGGGLNNWQDDDDPWKEHALWFPRCYLVKQKKSLMPRSVRFSKDIVYHIVPGREEDRRGTWHLDAARFTKRIHEFENLFLKVKIN